MELSGPVKYFISVCSHLFIKDEYFDSFGSFEYRYILSVSG